LRDLIRLIPNPVWSLPGKRLFICGKGPGAAIKDEKPSGDCQSIATETIDSIAKGAGTKIQFIKMDIEGAELEALRGAEQTLLRDKPKLAIAIYHRPHDFGKYQNITTNWVLGMNIICVTLQLMLKRRHYLPRPRCERFV